MIIALTGGIASGKSAVARLLAELGAQVVDADAISRELVGANSPVLAEIVDRFGTEILSQNGSLDRRRLGQIVFSDAEARADLERILHPRIFAEIARRLAAMDPKRPRVVEAALLVETGAVSSGRLPADILLLVSCPRAQQIERLTAAGMREADAVARIDSQASLEEKAAAADRIIDNSGSLEDLRAQVLQLWPTLSGEAGPPAQ